MNYVLDGALLFVIFLTVFVYYKRGFVKAVLGLGKTLFAFISAIIFGKSMGAFLAESYFDAKITDLIYNKLFEAVGSDMTDLVQKIPSSIRTLAEHCGADINAIVSGEGAMQLDVISAKIAHPISAMISYFVGYVVVFIGAYLIFLLLAFVLESTVKLPLFRTANRILGLCLGCICAVIFAFIFVFIAQSVIYYIVAHGEREAAMEIINNTHLFKYICEIEMANGLKF